MRVVVPHAGAYLPIALPRMRSLYPVMRKNGLVGVRRLRLIDTTPLAQEAIPLIFKKR